MKTGIFDRLTTAARIIAGTLLPEERVQPEGHFDIVITRADGTVERRTRRNVVTDRGLNRLANRMVVGATTSPMHVLGIGTVTAAHSLGSVQAGVGEVSRKVAASIVQSREWFALTMTWAGNADGLTGILLDTAFITDHPNSHASTGIIAAVTNAMSVTLAASDFLNLTYRGRVGSHDIAHST